MTQQRFRYLLNGWLLGTLSPAEAEEFLQGAAEPECRVLVTEALEAELEAGRYDGRSTAAMRINALARLKEHDAFNPETITVKPVHRIPSLTGGKHFLRTAWFRYAAAILIFVGLGTYLWLQNPKPDSTTVTPVKAVQNDIAPGFDRAVLTLSNGQQIVLDSAGSETIQDGALSIKNTNGQLTYSDPERGSISPAGGGGREAAGGGLRGEIARTATNILTTPRGGMYLLILPDGSKAWLNAASSITFPTAFTGNTREVKMTGEVYFEVKPDKAKPFVVNTTKDRIEVLGTSFNVNAYPEEPAIKSSLLEGSVRIGNSILRPHQAYIDGKVVQTDVAQDIAWKNGAFNFKNVNADVVLRQISRWYNVNIRYTAGIPDARISGEMGRDLNLSQVLSVLDGLEIRTKLEGQTLLILSE